MSKARLVITAVVHQNRSVTEVAASYGVHRGSVYRWLARWRLEGEAAYEPRSTAPHTHPNATPEDVVQAVLIERDRLTGAGHDAGPETISAYLERRDIKVSRATTARILTRHGKVAPEPKKKPKSAYIRFAAEQPNETWQSDFTHIRLADGTDTEVITWLDDHSRMALHVSVHTRITALIALETFTDTADEYGYPATLLTDNGMVYTVKRSATGVRGGRTALQAECARRGITFKNGRGNHPQTQGKVERFQQTLKAWLSRHRPAPTTPEQLQALIDTFVLEYNNQRPHRALNRRTPRAAYLARPKAAPSEPTDRTHARVRHDKVSEGKITLRHASKLFHIGLGRHLNGRPVVALVHDLHITISDAQTGEILRELTLDTTRPYQPINAKQGEP